MAAESTTEILTAVFGVELSESESEELRAALASEAGGDAAYLESLSECMLAMGLDESDDDAKGFHFNPGYAHAVGVVMGESTYSDVRKLFLKPPSKFAKKFSSEFSARMEKIGIKRRAKGILVTQQRKEA